MSLPTKSRLPSVVVPKRPATPTFSYPGSKNRLAQRIISLFPPEGQRFVDCFTGRGAITWHVMSLLNYKNYWINAVGTYRFFDQIRHLGSIPEDTRRRIIENYHIQTKNRTYYEREKANTVRADLLEQAEAYEEAGRPDIGAAIRREDLGQTSEDEANSAANPVVEAYLSFSGGNYGTTGMGGSVSRDGFRRKFLEATLLFEKNWKRTKLTAIDYRRVLAQCTASDTVYLDPPYIGYDMGSYSEKTIDYAELIRLLLNAKFRWVLSEYDINPIYRRAFGEPIRIKVKRSMSSARGVTGERTDAEECLWSNFEPHYISQSLDERGIKMAKIDPKELLAKIQKEKDELDIAIKALTKVIQRDYGPGMATKKTAPARKRRAAQAPAEATKTRKRKPLSAAVRKRLRESTKKRWAVAKKAGKTSL